MVKKIVILLVLLLIAGLGYWYFFRTLSDTDKIKNQFSRLSEFCSKNPGEGTSSAAIKSYMAESLFAEKCELDTNESMLSGVYTQQDINSKAIMMRKRFAKARMNIYDLSTKLTGKDQAQATFTINLCGTLKDSARTVNESREMQAFLQKDQNGNWLFSKFKVIEVLKK
jgi:hypothetical protein